MGQFKKLLAGASSLVILIGVSQAMANVNELQLDDVQQKGTVQVAFDFPAFPDFPEFPELPDLPEITPPPGFPDFPNFPDIPPPPSFPGGFPF